jgi:hypothetical protein
MLKQLSRSELGNAVNHYPYSAYEKAMSVVFEKGEEVGKVGYNSAVYYVRATLEKKFDVVYPLPYVEALMREMGWRDGRRRPRHTK